ncbi:sulfatase-like hydrolase/transferase (plasmid) [Halorussus limi]|uniref:Sulfatase-like hydrolase/transferase n=1 Tax=Halorussus limi TaxID=2938695 RepID=A0A8U0I1N9_9EURY|nr:sulfatase-like hydrolase/transferase [Halorussus limi]
MTSIHSGLYPHEHEAIAHTYPDDESYAIPAQPTDIRTLPAEFEVVGYDTYAGCAFMVPFLALRGWYQTHRVYRNARSEVVLEGYRNWRRNQTRSFAYLHLSDLHTPISPPKRYRGGLPGEEYVLTDDGTHELRHSNRCEVYDGCPDCREFRKRRLELYKCALKYVEDQLRPLIEEVRDDTLIVVTGDHGEAVGEHYELDYQFTDSRPNAGVGHGGTPFDSVARVPLGILTPDEPAFLPVGGWANLIDLPGTVLASVTDEEQNPFPGMRWQEPIPEDRTVFCEASRFGTERKAAYCGPRKLIRSETDDVTLTAQVVQDGEQFRQIPEDIESELLDALPPSWDSIKPTPQVSKTVRDRLEELGYT